MQENSMGVEEVRSTIMELQNGIDEKFEQNIEKRLTEMKKCHSSISRQNMAHPK